jgi:hypothetical protein
VEQKRVPFAVVIVLALPKSINSAEVVVFVALILVATWCFLTTAVIVDANGLTYRAFHRTIRLPWQRVAEFAWATASPLCSTAAARSR